ncbi:MAG: transposase [Acidobacteriota bacterium]
MLKVLKEFEAVEALRFYEAFRQRWQQREPEIVSLLERYFPLTIAYYACHQQWRHRVRTTNLAESLFRNLWRFMGRFPSFQDEDHSSRVLGTYLLGLQRYKQAQEVLPYAL